MKKCLGCFKEIPSELEICPYCGYVVGTPAQEAIHMEPGTILADRYLIGKVIGYGGFGVTYIAWDSKLEQRVAIKEYLPSEFATRMPGKSAISVFGGEKSEQFRDGMNKFTDEARKLAKFQSEDGIVKVFDCITENNTAYIVMEYLEGETLKELLKKRKTIPEDEAIAMLMPVMESLRTVHANGILHRDIAPENIFITKDGSAKLIDFGAARFATTTHSRSLTVIVKPGYSPEEQYRSRGDQGPHTDVYSVAATLYRMVTGATPPDALERRAKIETTKKDIITEPRKLNSSVSVRRENALLNALNVRIEDRTATIDQLIEELNSETPVKRRYGKIKKIDFYRWPLWLKVTVPTVVTIIVVFGLLLATGVISFQSLFSSEVILPDGYDRVPYVVSMNKDEAAELIEKAGFNYAYSSTVVSEYLDKDTVISQDPESGGIYPKNSVISLVICEGDGSDPGLLYKAEDTIKAILDEKSITYSVEYEYSNVESGLICRVVLADGTEVEYPSEIPEGGEVILYVSLGLQPVEVPDFYNMTIEDAVAKLYELGLVPDEANYIYEVTDEVEPGYIFGQSVAAGQEVTIGTAISFSIAVEETTELIEVPDVKGMDQSTATTTLENAGFKVTVYQESSSSVPAGNVTRQSPISGLLRPDGSTIVIYVSSGVGTNETSPLNNTGTTTQTVANTKSYVIPDVEGLYAGDAFDSIYTAGFQNEKCIDYIYENSDVVEDGYVISQYPAAGTVYDTTDISITLYVSIGSSTPTPMPTPTPIPNVTCVMPDVIGLSDMDAVCAIPEDSENNVTLKYVTSYTGKIGNVIDQFPAAGETYNQSYGDIVLYVCCAYGIDVSDDGCTASMWNGEQYNTLTGNEELDADISVVCTLGPNEGTYSYSIIGQIEGTSIKYCDVWPYDSQVGSFSGKKEAYDFYETGTFDACIGPNCVAVDFYDSDYNYIGTRFSNVVEYNLSN